MTEPFAAQAIVATRAESAADRLEITLSDAMGCEHTLTLAAETAAALALVLGEFARSARPASSSQTLPTKMPSEFAIGAGRFEQVVLVRFEDDVPYGLAAEEALRLGRALIAEAEEMAATPAPMRQ